MRVQPSLTALLREPSCQSAWALRGDLLEAGFPPDAAALAILDELHRFLDRLATGSASRDLSERASRLDMGALGGVVVEELLEAVDRSEAARRLLAAVVAEGLAVLATRQHVHAWRGELGAVFRDAAWFLYGAIWQWTKLRNPGLADDARRRLLDGLIQPLLGDALGFEHRAVVTVGLFDLLLVDALGDEVTAR